MDVLSPAPGPSPTGPSWTGPSSTGASSTGASSTGASSTGTVAASPGRRSWRFWRLPPRLVAAALIVEAAAVGLVVVGLLDLPTGGGPLPMALGLAVIGVLHTELATGIERARRRAAETSYFDLSSVWTFAAALLLPPGLAALVIAVVYLHLWHRVWAPAGVPLYRHVYTSATVLLAARAAHEVAAATGGLAGGAAAPAVPGIALAVGVYVLVNTVLVGLAIVLTGPGVGLRGLLGRADDNALEMATVCMGALAAVALGSAPGLVALALPPILVLHRAVLVRQLEEAVSTDAKTGLLTVDAWRADAADTVCRVQRSGGAAGVLILDLDHFKAVNDTHGHLAGDDVLAAVAAELRAGVREQDVVGRFGGEEFVVLLPDLPTGGNTRTELWRVAERLRRRVARLHVAVATSAGPATIAGLSISVGGAAVPADGTTLDQVLRTADTSLYAAKGAGRNAVRIAADGPVPSPRRPSA